MKRIDTLQELRAERIRLLSRRYELEEAIKQDVKELKAGIAPVLAFSQGAGSFFSGKNNSILGSSAGFLIDLLMKSVVLRNAGFVTRLVVPFLMKFAASGYVNNHKEEVLGWIGRMINKFRGKKDKDPEPATDERYYSDQTFI